MKIVNEDWSFDELISRSDSLIESIKSIKDSVIYRIYDKESKSYIGTTRNLYNRLYNKFHGHVTSIDREHCDYIHKMMKLIGYSEFRFQILEKSNELDYILKMEPFYIEKYNSYNNGYNRNNTGKLGPGIGSVSLYNETDDIYVRVKPSEVKLYLDNGYIRKSPNKETKQLISPNGDFVQVPKSKIEDLLYEGYKMIGFSYGTKWIYSYEDEDYFMVSKDTAYNLVNKGLAKLESPSKGLINIYNDSGVNIRVPKDQLDEYLLNGYKRGNLLSKGKISIINKDTNECIRINKEDLYKYTDKGWTTGSKKRKVMFNPDTGRQINITDYSKIDEFLSKGFIEGKCNHGGKIFINNGIEYLRVDRSELDKYRKLGYNKFGKLKY